MYPPPPPPPTIHRKMFNKKQRKPRVNISLPSNFEHRVHTGYDRDSGKYMGLPRQWANIIRADEKRPSPIVDPSLITPTEVTGLKVSLVGGSSMVKLTSWLLTNEIKSSLVFRVLLSRK